jgi:hypothetical protein
MQASIYASLDICKPRFMQVSIYASLDLCKFDRVSAMGRRLPKNYEFYM